MTDDQRRDRHCKLGRQRTRESIDLSAEQGLRQGFGADHVQPGRSAEHTASVLQIGAHRLAATGQREHDLAAGAGTAGRKQHQAKGQLAQVGALGRAGELVGPGRRPDPQRQRFAEALPPAPEHRDALHGPGAVGRADPKFGGAPQAVLRPQGIQTHPFGMRGIQVQQIRRQPTEDRGDDGPARAEGAKEELVGSAGVAGRITRRRR